MAVSFTKVIPGNSEPNSLRFQLHKKLANRSPGRDLKNLHASDMTKGFCPRQRLITVMKGLGPKDEYCSASLQMTFDLGNAIEGIVIKHSCDAGIAHGDWQCVRCDHMHRWRTQPERCLNCDYPKPVYKQRRWYSRKSAISCGIDLLVKGFGPKLRIVECKSMQKDDFRKLMAPLAEHKLRTNLYMRIAEESDDEDAKQIDTENAFVLYVDKGGYGILDGEVANWKLGDRGFSPFKEFVVKRDDSTTDEMCARGSTYREAVLTKTICAGICVGSADAPAQKCNVATECFSGKFPIGSKF